jgi:transcription antitermination factor NusG
MRLAESLARDGFEVWTPIETRNVRIPKANIRREVRQAIMPSYVFARVKHLVDLLELAAMPVKPRRGAGRLEAAHASFSVMHCRDRIPVVADRHLSELRRIEAKRTPIKRASYCFPKDAVTRVREGAFTGLVGVVVRSTPAKTVLRFTGGFPVEIPTSLLDRNRVEDEQRADLKAA